MNCVSCQARLAPRSTHCYFCGATQPAGARAPVGGGTPSGTSPYGPGSYAQWMSSSEPNSEGWRLWASFFLGGLYGPIASRYLYQREEWNAGRRPGKAAPTAPSNRGLVVLGMFVGLPMLFILVLGFVISANEVSWYGAGNTSWNLDEAHGFAFANLFVAGFYLLSLTAARQMDRRFQLLLYELTGGDRQTLDTYRRGRGATFAAAVMAAAPFGLLTWMSIVMRQEMWSPDLDTLAVLYMFLIMAATWATSWLNVTPVSRFRRAMLARP